MITKMIVQIIRMKLIPSAKEFTGSVQKVNTDVVTVNAFLKDGDAIMTMIVEIIQMNQGALTLNARYSLIKNKYFSVNVFSS